MPRPDHQAYPPNSYTMGYVNRTNCLIPFSGLQGRDGPIDRPRDLMDPVFGVCWPDGATYEGLATYGYLLDRAIAGYAAPVRTGFDVVSSNVTVVCERSGGPRDGVRSGGDNLDLQADGSGGGGSDGGSVNVGAVMGGVIGAASSSRYALPAAPTPPPKSGTVAVVTVKTPMGPGVVWDVPIADGTVPAEPQPAQLAMTAPTPAVVLTSEVLGKGTYGKVVVGTYSGQRVAVKLFVHALLPQDLLAVAVAAKRQQGSAEDSSDAHSWLKKSFAQVSAHHE
ncbi:hypothetical protein HYH03_010445 [Edaphochlamys debaryana]|uniref:Protein kinase domain-containing protein n=1 Tax=Edaphochlamys debaryana TaxID=47281 RepID=A0A835XU67_9CHLO|nr:hypothetical protein HYH03_010445 [Edaphochlamys debaryana]|eukprot:KAG2491237.1 hypothetical protein HYH03_010445 [Edaphochlamys debaryana]